MEIFENKEVNYTTTVYLINARIWVGWTHHYSDTCSDPQWHTADIQYSIIFCFVFFVLHYVPCNCTLHVTICNCGSLHYKPWLLWDSFCNFWVCICDFYFLFVFIVIVVVINNLLTYLHTSDTCTTLCVLYTSGAWAAKWLLSAQLYFFKPRSTLGFSLRSHAPSFSVNPLIRFLIIIIIIIIAPLTKVKEDQWGDLECLFEVCQAAITDGGLFTYTGENELGENERQSENDYEIKAVS